MDTTAYLDVVNSMAEKYPQVSDILMSAQRNRSERLQALSRSAKQLAACDEVITYAHTLEAYFRSQPSVERIAFLLQRVIGDLRTAVEATLSGFHKVVNDATRDMMEIEFLLRDFALKPAHMEEWLEADERVLRQKYQPAALRRRFAESTGLDPMKMSDALDYKGHSMMLHVVPYENPVVWATPAPSMDAVGTLICFIEILEHSRRLFYEANQLCAAIGLDPPDPREVIDTVPTVLAEATKLFNRVAPFLFDMEGAPRGGSDRASVDHEKEGE